MKHPGRQFPQISSGSMADIAFLLLTFYLLTTVIDEQKGLTLLLPPVISDSNLTKIKDRNLFTIQINSSDQLLVEGESWTSTKDLRSTVKKFILNENHSLLLSESPKDAIISIKADRGTSHKLFIDVLDEVQAAYYEIYSDRADMSTDKFRSLNINSPSERKIYDNARAGIPMNISIAEPTGIASK